MTAELEQIKISFEELGMTPEEIASDRGLELAAVKSALMQGSSKYRRACGVEGDSGEEFNFSPAQHKEVMRVIYELAIGAEDEHLRGKLATYIRDDIKGRKDAPKQMSGQTINILTINEALRRNREISDKIKAQVTDV